VTKRRHTLSIRKTTYRGLDGFLICGHPPEPYRKVFPVSIFVRTREAAEAIKSLLLVGEYGTRYEPIQDTRGKR
jgi:hypothetical protein